MPYASFSSFASTSPVLEKPHFIRGKPLTWSGTGTSGVGLQSDRQIRRRQRYPRRKELMHARRATETRKAHTASGPSIVDDTFFACIAPRWLQAETVQYAPL